MNRSNRMALLGSLAGLLAVAGTTAAVAADAPPLPTRRNATALP